MQALPKLPVPTAPPCPPGRISGRYYAAGYAVPGSSGTTTLNTLNAIPFYVGNPCEFDRISVNALNTASSIVRLGIYADDNGKPGALIVDAGQISTALSGMADATINVRLSGLVWVAVVPQSVTGSMSRYGTPNYGGVPIGMVEHYSSFFNAIAFAQTGISGQLPNPWGPVYTDVGSANTVPAVWLRAK